MDIEKRVKDIIAEELGNKLEEIRPEAKLTDVLGAGDLEKMELVLALEEELGITISDEDIEKLLTVKDVIDYTKKKVEDKSKA